MPAGSRAHPRPSVPWTWLTLGLLLAPALGAPSLLLPPAAAHAGHAPTAPRNLDAYPYDIGMLAMDWDGPADTGGSINFMTLYRGTTPTDLHVADYGGHGDPSGAGSYVDVGLEDGETWCYAVTVANAFGTSPLSNVDCATTWDGPSAPRNFTGTALGPTAIQLTWLPPASDGGQPVQSYTIWRGTAPTGSFPFLATVSGSATSYTNSGLPPGSRYYYRIAALNSVGFGDSAQTNGTTTPPAAPANLAATPGVGAITLSWHPPATVRPLLDTRVYALQPNGTYALLATVGAATSHTESGLADGVSRTYRVAGLNEGGEGPWSQVSGVTLSVPGTPPNVVAQPGPAPGEVQLAWGTPSPQGGLPPVYRIYAGTDPGSLTLLAERVTQSFVDGGRPAGQVRYYRVSASNDLGESAPSPLASARVPQAPSAPTAFRAQPSLVPGWVTLDWQAPADPGGLGLTSYRIYRGTATGALTLYATVSGTTLTYTDRLASLTQPMRYAVAAVNPVDEGPQTAPACTSAYPFGLQAPLGPPCPA